MNEQQHRSQIVRWGDFIDEMKKYPTRWEMIAYLGGAVVANRLVVSITSQNIPEAAINIVKWIYS